MNDTILIVAVFASSLAGVCAGTLLVLAMSRVGRERQNHPKPASAESEIRAAVTVEERAPDFASEAERWAETAGRPEMAGPMARRMRTIWRIGRRRGLIDDQEGSE